MGSITIQSVRDEFPDKSDREAAAAFAEKWGTLVIVRYKNTPDGEYHDFGLCDRPEEVDLYLHSSACHDVEIVYDRRRET